MNISQHCFVPFSFSVDPSDNRFYRSFYPYAPLSIPVSPFPVGLVLPLVSFSSADATGRDDLFYTIPMSYLPKYSRPNTADHIFKILLYF